MKRTVIRGLLVFVALLVVTGGVLVGLWYRRVQQAADPDFDTSVARPAYPSQGPRVLFDEAHNNFHTASGRYKPFADLISHDGYQVVRNGERFQRSTLDRYQVLVVANAMGAWLPILPGAGNPAFTSQECDAVRDWVREGGSLLLIADHEPAGAAAQPLAQRFDVQMSEGRTFDPSNYVEDVQSTSWVLFTPENGLLGDHAIIRGRDSSEVVKRVIAFTGQSLKGPDSSSAFLKLGDSAYDVLPSGERVPASGRAVGIALQVGEGRVVVVGEAAMLSAQVVGNAKLPMGMNYSGNDNRQLALNIMRWLTGVLN